MDFRNRIFVDYVVSKVSKVEGSLEIRISTRELQHPQPYRQVDDAELVSRRYEEMMVHKGVFAVGLPVSLISHKGPPIELLAY